MQIRDYDEGRDYDGLRECFIELQNYERGLNPGMPAGEDIADRYLQLMFARGARYGGRVLVAEVERRVVGFISVWTHVKSDEPDDDPTPFAHISDLVVLRTHRRSGIGNRLLTAAAEHAKSQGATQLHLHVKAGNVPAIGLYRRHGFKDTELELRKRL